MDPLLFVVLAFLGATAAGTLGALLGIGGGIIVIPGLTLLLGIDIHFAAGASLIAVLATSTGGAAAFTRLGLTNRRLALLLAVATTTGALVGAYVGGVVSGQVLYLVFAVVVLYAAAMMLRRRGAEAAELPSHPWASRLSLAGTYPDMAQKRQIAYGVAGVPLALIVVFLGGIFSGLLGVGGGPFNVPAMDQIMRVPLKVVAATSNMLIGITAAASVGVYFARGDIVPLVAVPVALGVLLGAAIGARLLMRVPVLLLRRVFVVALVVVAIQMGLKGLA